MAGIALALCSSWLAGTGDFCAGLLSRRVSTLTIVVGVVGIGILVLTAIAIVAGEPVPSTNYLALGFAAGTAGVSGLLLLYRALAIGPMSVVSPVSALAAVLPVAVGLLTGDRVDSAVIAGIGLAIAGGVLVASPRSTASVEWDRAGVAIALAAGAAFLIGLDLVALHAAVQASPLWTAIAARVGGAAAIGCGCAVRGDAIRPLGSPSLGILVVALLNTGAILTLVEANSLGSLSIVAALASLYPVPTVVLALMVLHEPIRAAQLVGVAGVMAGVTLLGLS